MGRRFKWQPPVDVVEDERYVDCAVWGSGSIIILQPLFGRGLDYSVVPFFLLVVLEALFLHVDMPR